MRRHTTLVLFLLLVLAVFAGVAFAQDGYDLSWWTVDSGGGTWSTGVAANGSTYAVGGTIGQIDAGNHASSAYALQGGFWDTRLAPSLIITKTAEDLNGPPLYEGDVVEYVVTVSNTAVTTHTGVLVQDAIPSGTTYVPGSADPAQTSGPDPLIWMLPTLAPDEGRTFTFRVTVDDGLRSTPPAGYRFRSGGGLAWRASEAVAGQSIGGNVAAATSDQHPDPVTTPPIWPPDGGEVQPAPELQIAKTAEDLNGMPLYEGDVLEYTIAVTNTSAAGATGVTVSDTLPISTTYVENSAQTSRGAIVSTDPLVVDVGDLASGQSVVVSFQVTVDEGTVGQTIENQAKVSGGGSTPWIEPPGGGLVPPYLTIVKIAGDVNGPPLLAGDEIEYHVLVFNPATITATEVRVEDYVPVHTSYVANSASTTLGNITGPDPLWVDIDEQLPLNMIFFQFRATVDPISFVTTITNTVTATIGAHDPVTAQAIIGPVGGDNVGLVIGKTAEDLNGSLLYEGDTVEYIIGLANTDDITHTNVVVSDAIPSGTTYVPGSADPPPANAPDPLVWTLKNLPPNKTIVFFTFHVTVDQGMAGQSIGGNVAIADSDQQDEPVETPAVYPAAVTPLDPPGHVSPFDLSIVKTAEDLDGAPLYEGDVIRYAITVTNDTTDTTHTHVVVQDAVPTGLTYVDGSASPTQDSGPNPLVWTVATLEPGQSRTFTFQVTVDEGLRSTASEAVAGQTVPGNVAMVTSDQREEPIFTAPIRPPDPIVRSKDAPTDNTVYLPLVFRQAGLGPERFRIYLPLTFKNYSTRPPSGDEYEPDDACTLAKAIVPGSPQSRTFDPAYDEDWISLHMTAGQTYIIQTGDLSGGADTILQLYAPDCVVLLAENDDHAGELWSRIEWTATQTANHYLRVRNYDPTVGSPEMGYSISVQQLP